MWAAFFDRPHVAAALGPGRDPGEPPPGVADPGPDRQGRLAHGRVLFVGDAAGGHRRDDRRGHRSGAPHRPARRRGDRRRWRRRGRRYTREVRRELVADHRMSVLLGRALQHRGRTGRDLDRRARRRLGPPQLRPLDVRGRAAGDPRDPPPLAPPLPHAAPAPTSRQPRDLTVPGTARRRFVVWTVTAVAASRDARCPSTSTRGWADEILPTLQRLHRDPQRVAGLRRRLGGQRPHGAGRRARARLAAAPAGRRARRRRPAHRRPDAADRVRGPGHRPCPRRTHGAALRPPRQAARDDRVARRARSVGARSSRATGSTAAAAPTTGTPRSLAPGDRGRPGGRASRTPACSS